MIKKIIIDYKEKVRYKRLAKNNIFNQYSEKNYFGKGTSLNSTKWGRYSGCNANCEIVYINIGNYSQLAQNVVIGLRNHIFTNYTINDFPYIKNGKLPKNA